MAYNGWHNYETWNVNLWATNEEWSYRMIQRGKPFTASSAKALAQDMFGNQTPDKAKLSKVKWSDIAAAWNEK